MADVRIDDATNGQRRSPLVDKFDGLPMWNRSGILIQGKQKIFKYQKYR
jgi:hypothetical protein